MVVLKESNRKRVYRSRDPCSSRRQKPDPPQFSSRPGQKPDPPQFSSRPESGVFISSDNSKSNKRKRETESPPESGEFIPSPSDESPNKRMKQILKSSGCVFDYTWLEMISSGAYGVVYSARDKKTGEIVAVKKELEGLSIASLREIEILKSLGRHPNLVRFKEVASDGGDGVYVVMEYVNSDLKRYMDARKKPLELHQVKFVMWQLLAGVKFLHENKVMHRDLKPSNLLIDSGSGKLKICDFGISRNFGTESGKYSTNIVSLWYRAPELLLGAKTYSSAIDMWSVGCIMAEMVLKDALFPVRSEIEQLCMIYRVLGTPNERIWPGFGALPGSKVKLIQQPRSVIPSMLSAATSVKGSPVLTDAGFKLLNGLLTYDPAKRLTAKAALAHPWFKER